MPNDLLPQTIADMPPQRARAPLTPAQDRGRFFNTGNAFDVRLTRRDWYTIVAASQGAPLP